MKNEDKRDETKLNPFDRQVTDLQLVREEMTEIAEKNDFKMDDFVRIVKIYERICEELTEIAEDSTVPTVI
uniref:Histidine kinase n=1 Tax=Caenorhabditis tropicalis TaxID=1561998 RepID=A0A1I7TRZ9_9PELO